MNPHELLILAWRNVLRNGRRTLLTLAAVSVAGVAMLLLSGYVKATMNSLETDAVRNVGHLQVMSADQLRFGRGQAGRYALHNVHALMSTLRQDPQLRQWIRVMTPTLQVQGVAGVGQTGTSATFSASAWIPEDRAALLSWAHPALDLPAAEPLLQADQPQAGVIGHGLAQVLGLCEALTVPDCQHPVTPSSPPDETPIPADLAHLSQMQAPGLKAPHDTQAHPNPWLDLLAASAQGAPNVVRMQVLSAQRQSARELDAAFLTLPLPLAQRLVFGPDTQQRASAIVVQLHRTADLPAARSRIEELLGSNPAFGPLKVHDVNELQPSFGQVVQLFQTIFRFVSLLMLVVTAFSVTNTLNMAVSERTAEIGTLRAIGLRRSGVVSLFLYEGLLLGLVGALLGLGLALLIGEVGINHSGWHWTPPGRQSPVPLRVDIVGTGSGMLAVLAGLMALAAASAWWPARRASRLEIVEALRHA